MTLQQRRRRAESLAKTEAAAESRPKRKVSRQRYAISVVVLAVVALVYAGFATGHVGNYEVISNSMAPTLLKGDRVLVDQRPHRIATPGDVIVLNDPESSGQLLTKRVAAVEGQKVEIAGDYLVVDGERWAPGELDPIPLSPDRQLRRMTIGKDEVFVVGDNIDNSEDSLVFGPVPAQSVKGKVLFIYWPPARAGRVK